MQNCSGNQAGPNYRPHNRALAAAGTAAGAAKAASAAADAAVATAVVRPGEAATRSVGKKIKTLIHLKLNQYSILNQIAYLW